MRVNGREAYGDTATISVIDEMVASTAAGAHLDLLAKFFRGLVDPARLRLVVQLRTGEQAAGELARRCSLSPSNASNHLQCLLECGLVEVESRGRQNFYRLADPALIAVLGAGEGVLRTRAGALIRRRQQSIRTSACSTSAQGVRRQLSMDRPEWVTICSLHR